MNPNSRSKALDAELSLLESETLNFATRFIKDAKVRANYIQQTQRLSREYRAMVAAGTVPPEAAAQQVHALRNQILAAQRLQSSDIGLAKAVGLKKEGLTLLELTEKYARSRFGVAFESLPEASRNQVYLEIIESAGRARPGVNVAATRLGRLGRGLVIVSIGVAVYNVAEAKDKPRAIAREGVVFGGGFAGGAAGGALAGLACGPGAPVCVTIGVFIGGALGAMGADVAFGWVF